MNTSKHGKSGVLLTAPMAQRALEKEATKSFNFKEKFVYYSQRKTTWTALAGIGYAFYTKDYFGAFNLIAGLF